LAPLIVACAPMVTGVPVSALALAEVLAPLPPFEDDPQAASESAPTTMSETPSNRCFVFTVHLTS
jgi:hypothetical protein